MLGDWLTRSKYPRDYSRTRRPRGGDDNEHEGLVINLQKIGVPMNEEDATKPSIIPGMATDEDLYKGTLQLKQLSAQNSALMRTLVDFSRIIAANTRKIVAEQNTTEDDTPLFNQMDPSTNSGLAYSYDTEFEVDDSSSSKKRALKEEGKKVALEKFKQNNLTPSDLYLLNKIYPDLFADDKKNIQTLWTLEPIIDNVLGNFTPLVKTAVQQTTLLVNNEAKLDLQPWHIILCVEPKCRELFTQLCAYNMKNNRMNNRLNATNAASRKQNEQMFLNLKTSARFVGYDHRTHTFSLDSEQLKLYYASLTNNVQQNIYRAYGVSETIIKKKFPPPNSLGMQRPLFSFQTAPSVARYKRK
jgi:hypothetical protein